MKISRREVLTYLSNLNSVARELMNGIIYYFDFTVSNYEERNHSILLVLS